MNPPQSDLSPIPASRAVNRLAPICLSGAILAACMGLQAGCSTLSASLEAGRGVGNAIITDAENAIESIERSASRHRRERRFEDRR